VGVKYFIALGVSTNLYFLGHLIHILNLKKNKVSLVTFVNLTKNIIKTNLTQIAANKKRAANAALFYFSRESNDYFTIFFSTDPSLYKYNNTSPLNCSAGLTS